MRTIFTLILVSVFIFVAHPAYAQVTPSSQYTNFGQSEGAVTPGQTTFPGSGVLPTQNSQSQPVFPTQNSQSQPLSNGTTGNTSGGLTNPLTAGTNLSTLIQDILQFVVQIGTVVVILMLVYVGFLFTTAQGEPGKISTARQALLYTVIGALILLGAQAIASGIQATAQALSSGS